MIQLTPQMRILLAVEPADFRKGIDGLAQLCRQRLQDDPLSGALFVFANRRRKALKLLVYDGQGFWLCQKRLSQGRFNWWPPAGEAASSGWTFIKCTCSCGTAIRRAPKRLRCGGPWVLGFRKKDLRSTFSSLVWSHACGIYLSGPDGQWGRNPVHPTAHCGEPAVEPAAAFHQTVSGLELGASQWASPGHGLPGPVAGLHRAGLIELPAKRMSPPNPLARRAPPPPLGDQSWDRVEGPLSGLGPIEIRQVRRTAEEKLFGSLMQAHHYLGYTQPVGEHLKYVYYARGKPVACMAWSSSPRHLGARDRVHWLERGAAPGPYSSAGL